MLALIDGDIVAFRCAASAEGETESFIPFSRAENLVEQIIQETKADSYKIYLSGVGNFRYEIFPQYKANRKQPSPKWLVDTKRFLVNEWDAETVDGIEADDALGIEQCRRVSETVICSIDKDLRQIPGRHFNFVTKEHFSVDVAAGIRTFYTQLLVGDPTDNISGCPGIGKVKAPKILEGCETEDEMFNAVRETYKNDELMLMNGKLLWILREKDGIWDPEQLNPANTIKQDREALSVSTQ